MHADRVLQATPLNKLTFAPAGFGVVWTLDLTPFERSTKVTPLFELVTCVPTPMHEEALVHVPNSNWPVGARGFGVG